MLLFGLPLLILGPLAPTATAQDQRSSYQTWPGAQTDKRSQELVDRLRSLIDEAARARAADPRFLNDLRELAGTYDWPWRVRLIDDDFHDGDFTRNPVWTVTSGRFAVEWGIGLRTVVTPPPAPAASQQRESRPEDLAVNLLGALLKQQSGQQQPAQQQQAGPSQAEIHTARQMSNAFAARLELISRAPRGTLEFGPYQGADRATGYRLAYAPGATPSVKLLRVSKWGTGVIEAYPQKLNLEDGKPHVVEWTRDAKGRMDISLDGKKLFSTGDRDILQPFDGFMLVNRGGDYGIRRISIQGAAKR